MAAFTIFILDLYFRCLDVLHTDQVLMTEVVLEVSNYESNFFQRNTTDRQTFYKVVQEVYVKIYGERKENLIPISFIFFFNKKEDNTSGTF